mmetsp:Transcript_50861/g.144118  ORF Transcript_50861/g.144118 Transcript_50861/m.144118 type:complete len:97 (-) Transcript_50861:53-343(-)
MAAKLSGGFEREADGISEKWRGPAPATAMAEAAAMLADFGRERARGRPDRCHSVVSTLEAVLAAGALLEDTRGGRFMALLAGRPSSHAFAGTSSSR